MQVKNPRMTQNTRHPLLVVIRIGLVVAFVSPAASAQSAATAGQWQTLSYLMPINPVHTALMPNGKVLVVAGSGNYPPNLANNILQAAVWDTQAGTFNVQNISWDMFCSAMVVLPDGTPLIDGGTLQYDPFYGQPKAAVFDVATSSFTDVANMSHGRWYPTLTVLGDGTVMTFSGLDTNGSTTNTVEIFNPSSGTWSQPYPAAWTPPLYPRMHLLPNGNVFYSGATTSSSIFNTSTHSWATGVAHTNYPNNRIYGSSVLFPLTPANNYAPKVMILGGGSPATNTTEIIDLSLPTPTWQYAASMYQGRIEMNAVLLPNGKVLALGGSVNDEDSTTASLQAEIYNPATNTFGAAGSEAYARLYHSVALLMPDGRVWVAGGNPQRGTYEPHIEVYSPPYLFTSDANGTVFAATRPTISSSATSIVYGGNFAVQTPDAANISSVVLMRDGAPTHAFDMEQRTVGLAFTAGSGSLTVTAPPNSNVAPPGYYMLFLLNNSGVPSVAATIHVANQPQTATPSFSPPPGTYSHVLVTISDSTPGAAIYYTTDGTIPSTASNVYTGPIAVSSATTIQAIAVVSGDSSSTIASGTYAIQAPQTATPTFGPVPQSYSLPQSVTISDITPGATIYYTTNGTPPTTSSSIYTGPIVVNTSTTIEAIAVASGLATSALATATYVIGNTPVNYSGGFTTSGLTLNGTAAVSGTRLRLTDGGFYEAGSAYFNTPVNVQSFTATFSFQMTNALADGMTFLIQGNGTTALGPSGGGLGYGPDTPTGTLGIPNSVAVKFDIYDNENEGSDSTGMYTNGASPTVPAVDMTSSGVDPSNGDVYNVQITYDGTTLAMSITDATTKAKFGTNWAVNIPALVGGSTAYVGFTGATGGLAATQDVIAWTFTTPAPPVATPTFSPAPGTYGSALSATISDSTPGTTIYYTTNGTAPTTSSTVYTNPITVSTNTTIQAMAAESGNSNSLIASGTYTIQPSTLSALNLNPTTVTGASTSTGTVTLSAAAPARGTTVTLSSNSVSLATVPASVTVAGGATSATFTITTAAVTKSTSVTISASLNGTTKTANLNLQQLALKSISLSPTSVIGGNASTGTVTLNGPAAAGGSVVTISSSNSAKASAPANVTVAAGATSATFAVTTVPVSGSASVKISASFNGATQNANLTVTLPSLSATSLNPTTVKGGSTSTGTVTLNGVAPTGGVTVSLSSSKTSVATVPSNVTVAAGLTSATFTVKTSVVTTSTPVNISGSYGGTKSASLSVTP